MTFNATIFGGVTALVTDPDGGFTQSGTVTRPAGRLFQEGTVEGRADILFSDYNRELAASANEDLDLNGASLKDALGNDLAMLKVKAMWFRAAAANGGNIIVSPAAANGFQGPFGSIGDQIILPKGGEWQVADSVGWIVAPGTGDLINVANSDGSDLGFYDVVIIGASG